MQPYAPGPPPYMPAAPRHLTQFRPLGVLSKVVAGFLGLDGVLLVVWALALFNRSNVANDFVDSQSFSQLAQLDDADERVAGAAGLFLVVLLVVGVLWIVWQYLHATNAQKLHPGQGLGPGWAIGGWFVPVGNFALPALQLFGSARASDPALPPGGKGDDGKAPILIWFWWAALLLGLGVTFGGLSMHPDEETLGTTDQALAKLTEFADGDRLAGFGVLVLTFAALLAIAVVISLTSAQEAKIAAVGSHPGGVSGTAPGGFAPGGWQQPQPGGMPPQGGWGPPATAAPAGPGQYGSAGYGGGGGQSGPPVGAGQPTPAGFAVPGGSDPGAATTAGQPQPGPAVPPSPSPEPSWHPDPHHEAELRWWDGQQWTSHVSGQPRQE